MWPFVTDFHLAKCFQGSSTLQHVSGLHFFLFMDLPLCVYPFITYLIDIWVVSTFGLWWVTLWTFVYKLLCGHTFLFLLGIYLRMELLSHIVTMFNFPRSCQNFSKMHHFGTICKPLLCILKQGKENSFFHLWMEIG